MFLSKIRTKTSGILLYGITPPKEHTPLEKVMAYGERIVSNLSGCAIDALVVYDVQDESARTSEERPFPFASALDPLHFASTYLSTLPVPKILYRPASKFSKEELSSWLTELKSRDYYPVFVGLPSPDFVPKTSLAEAYELWRNDCGHNSVIGAVMIPERHALLKDEDARILDKVNSGVSYFISQCIFDLGYAKQVLADLVSTCGQKQAEIPTIIFTLTICGSDKTLQFMEWLGIYVPENVKTELRECDNQVLRSVQIAEKIASDLIDYCQEHAIPFGFNIESVAIRKDEIDASLDLLNSVNVMLRSKGLRNNTSSQTVEKLASAEDPL